MLRFVARLTLVVCALLLATAGDAAADPNIVLVPEVGFSFGSVDVGDAAGLEVAVVNEGTTAGTVGTATLAGHPSFEIFWDECEGVTLQPNQICLIGIVFAPTQTGYVWADLTVPSDSAGPPRVLQVSGQGVPGWAPVRVEPESFEFGTVPINRVFQSVQTFRVLFTDAVDSVAVRVDGPDAAAFELGTSCGELTSPIFSCGGTLGFRPTREGPHTAMLIVESDGFIASSPIIGVGGPPGLLRPPRVPPRLPPRPIPPSTPPKPTPPDEYEIQFSLSEALDAQVAQWRKRHRATFRRSGRFLLIAPEIASTGTLRVAIHTARGLRRMVAVGEIEYPGTGRPRVEAQLTRAGRVLLKKKRSRNLATTLSFKPTGKATVKVVLPFTLKR